MECYFTKGVLIVKPKDVENTIHIKKLIKEIGIKNALVNLSEYDQVTKSDLDNLKMKGINLYFFGIPKENLKELETEEIIEAENELTALSNFEI